jgi:GDP-D-mannose dehydratase
MENNKIILLTGSTGVIGSSIKDYFKTYHPEVKVICLFTPFSLQNLYDNLKDGNIWAFINAAGAPANEASVGDPYNAIDANTFGVLNQLEIIRKYSPKTKYINFGSIYEGEKTPYAASKRAARDFIKTYRENYGLFCTQVTLGFTEYYNRTEKFITRKISKTVAKIHHKVPIFLELENLDDIFNFTWGEDMADGIWKILTSEEPKEFTLINPFACSLREFVWKACKAGEISYEFNVVEKKSNRIGQPKIEINNPTLWRPLCSSSDIAWYMVQHDIKNYASN